MDINGTRVNSQARGEVVASAQDISVERTGQTALYLTSTGAIHAGDIRNGAQGPILAGGITRRGVSFSREGTRFLTAELVGGVWFAKEYNYPAMTFIRQTNLTALGASAVNSCRYSPNNRYYLIGHAAGALVIDTRTFTAVPLTGIVTGNVKDVEATSSMYALYARNAANISINIINNGAPMAYLGNIVWDELTASGWNWQVDDENPFPHLLLGGKRGADWRITPYRLGAINDYSESGQWDIIVPEKPLAFAFSELDTTQSNPQESFYGRAFVVFFASKYQVYDLLSGQLKAEFTSTPHSTISGGIWKEAQGLYL